MADPLIYVDVSEIREGRLDELKEAVAELAELVEAKEPRILAYHVYFNGDGTRMTVLHVHPDAGSLELHMEVAGPAFGKFSDYLTLRRIDLYGTPTPALLDRLRAKARLLGGATVAVHGLHAGVTRLQPR